MMTRRFARRQRTTLFLQAKGHCAICGRQLGAGWHADHVQAYKHGGKTSVSNGQALCPTYNMKKGSQIVKDTITYRPFQQRIVDALLLILVRLSSTPLLKAEERVLVANVFPGSGKTLAIFATLVRAFRAGVIDGALIYTPRTNLCQQLELDWEAVRSQFASPIIGDLHHRENDAPLLRNGEFGIITTYQSLVAEPALHLDAVKGRRFALVADEAQFLGYDPITGTGTRASEIFRMMAEHAALTVLLTGTPYRGDGSPLALGKYSVPDDDGVSHLLADVDAPYIEGVQERYLRPFEAELMNYHLILEQLSTGKRIEQKVSEIDVGLRNVLTHIDFFGPVIDRFIERVRAKQGEWARYCGLVGATDQAHARQIAAYIKHHHPDVRYLVAVSDDTEAHANLAKFKTGTYDVLITVGMAFIGYDHKPITVVCILTPTREPAWLTQFFGRGLRMASISGGLDDAQCLIAIVPDDPAMQRFVTEMRNASAAGLRLRKPLVASATGGVGPTGTTSWTVIHAEPTSTRSMANDADLDTDPNLFEIIEAARNACNLGHVPVGVLAKCIKLVRTSSVPGATTATTGSKLPTHGTVSSTVSTLPKTAKQREEELRSAIAKVCRQCDKILIHKNPAIHHGHSHSVANRKFGKGPHAEEQLRKILYWLETTWRPECLSPKLPKS